MNYQETCDYLFNKTANYESQGKMGYKEGLDTMLKLDQHFNHPHRKFKTIHVAGTNGKGSVSHTVAAQLQVCGYRVGLYTSPHLLNFNERIRINGNPIPEEYVVSFVEAEKEYFNQIKPTFFEIATIMAFQYFNEMDVDIAVIEVGLGGRLDSTNIITPLVSVITNISLDHTHLLGASIEQIAMEKGGIIKKGIPVIIGESTPETRPVFEALAAEAGAPITFASDNNQIVKAEPMPNGHIMYTNGIGLQFEGELGGIYQARNTNTTLFVMKELMDQGYLCSCEKEENLKRIQEEMNLAYANVCQLTGLRGRWETVRTNPTVVCDTGHNVGAWQYLGQQLAKIECRQMHIVFGMVDDKDIYGVMSLLPKNALYYFTKPNTKRALTEQSVQVFATQFELAGMTYPTVAEAYADALKNASEDDFIFVGGSTYVVADFLKTLV